MKLEENRFNEIVAALRLADMERGSSASFQKLKPSPKSPRARRRNTARLQTKNKQIPRPARDLFIDGRGWIRTNEGRATRFTVWPVWPLRNTPGQSRCRETGGR